MDLLEAKDKYGDIYTVTFEDNTRVVFRLLSFKEYEHFNSLYANGLIQPHDTTIYDRCKLDVIPGEKELRAGITHTVTNIILFLSGPKEVKDWIEGLDQARKSIDNIVERIEMIICRAFPAYKPEDIWKMSWGQIMKRLAQAEDLLVQSQVLKEKIKILDPKQQSTFKLNELVKEAQAIEHSEKAMPVARHSVGRESNWSKVKEYTPKSKKR